MEMKEIKEVVEYITWVETVANKLGRNEKMLLASRVVEKILRSLKVEEAILVVKVKDRKRKKITNQPTKVA